MKKLLRDFLSYQEARGRTQTSLRTYERYLINFFEFAHIKNPKDIIFDNVIEWQIYLKERGNSPSTIASKCTALRSFLSFLSKRDIKTLSPDKVELPKVSKPMVTFLTEQEIRKLLNAPNVRGYKGLRNKAILELFCSTGLRVSELCSLTKDQINFRDKEIILRGKGRKIRKVFLSEDAAFWLKKFLYNHRGEERLFYLTPRSIQRMIKSYAEKAGIEKNVSPHVLRRSTASRLLKGGMPLLGLKKLLGHSSLATTDRYLNLADDELKKSFEKAANGDGDKEALEKRLKRLEEKLDQVIRYLQSNL